jgi:hypothetical protein
MFVQQPLMGKEGADQVESRGNQNVDHRQGHQAVFLVPTALCLAHCV